MNSDDATTIGFDSFETAAAPSDAEVASIATLAERYLAQQEEVIRATAVLRAALVAMRQTAEVDLPDAMRASGATRLDTLGHQPVKLETKISARMLTDPAGLAWVEGRGDGSLIKTVLSVSLDRGDLEVARELMAILKAHRAANRYKELKLETSVHQSTIAAYARELIEAGEDPPLDLLGCARRSYAVVGSHRPKSVELKGLVER